jgi:hypothetical protein
MPWLDPLRFELVDERAEFPWAVIGPMRWMDPETREVHTIPDGFRTDGSSFPKQMMAIPIIGQFLAMRHFGNGIWVGFAAGTLHDCLRRGDENGVPPVPAHVAHWKFKLALQEDGFPYDVVENYYAAVVKYNS